MRVVILGSGSIFFTRRMVMGMVRSPVLRKGQLVLVDTHPEKCEQMGRFCRKMNETFGGELDISWTTERQEALPGADYVVLAFATRNYHYRETGTNLSKLYNVHLSSGETAGPSAVFRIIRAVPEVLRVAADLERLCPKAFVINYVNPTNVIGTALARHTKLRCYAFCDGMYECMGGQIAKYLGVEAMTWPQLCERYGLRLGGINHNTWLWGLEQDGHDQMARLKEGVCRVAEAEGTQHDAYGEWDLLRVFDAWPTLFCHSSEYLRYFQGNGSQPVRDHRVTRWSLPQRIRWYRNVWQGIRDCNAGKITVAEAMTDPSTDMVAAVLESIEGDLHRPFPVNVPNEGRIPNLPANTLVEVIGRFGRNTVDLPVVGPLPPGLAGLTLPSIEQQELALEAALTGNFRTVVKAVACDPLVMSLRDAEELARDLMAQEEENLDPIWDAYWRNPA
jgi:alpha-galactosidase